MYHFLDKSNTVLYVGKARDLKKRVSSYFSNKELGEKTRALVSQINSIEVTIVESELESLLLEANDIKKYDPKYNIRLTDGKAYPLIRIVIKDTYPVIISARHPDDKNSVYFGPFPSSKDVRLVLKTLRRIFPYQSVVNHPKRICLYHHLGLCPCPPVFDSPQLKKAYKETMKHIIHFLEGNTKKVLRDLENERDDYTNNEEFEKAGELQKKINAILYVTQPFHKPFEYELNPNLRTDIRHKELTQLGEHLIKGGVPVKELERIECYDMSNIQGHQYVGSMVVLTNGEIDKSQYRKFKIYQQPEGIPNDFAAMAEVITRRLKHAEWPTPDLIIVDGGKGQVSTTQSVLDMHGVSIPLIGIAKREELLITPDFVEIKLPKDSVALHLVQRIRDEAHRFAITYHRNLRSKSAYLNTSK